MYKKFGVGTIFEDENIILTKNNKSLPKSIHLNLIDNPDLAQTILITCLGLGIDCTLDRSPYTENKRNGQAGGFKK